MSRLLIFRIGVAVAVTQVVGGAAVAAGTALLSDESGTRIVFVLRDREVSRLYTIKPDGSDLRLLSRLPERLPRGGDVKPAWSSDGRRIAFARDIPVRGEDRLQLYVVRPDGSSLRRLTTGPAMRKPRVAYTFDSMPTWSADGRSIAFSRATAPGASLSWIFRVGVDGQGVVQWSEGGVFDFSPSWSPDGRTIAYIRARGVRPGTIPLHLPDAALVFQPLDGRSFGTGEVYGTDLAWSPDGSRIAYASFRGAQGQTCFRHGNLGRYIIGLDPARPAATTRCLKNGEIWLANVDRRVTVTRLTTTPADDRHPSWSPDGRILVFSSGFANGGGHPPWLYVMAADGGEPKLLYAPERGAALDPAWSPSSIG